jgi:hypothetical protein
MVQYVIFLAARLSRFTSPLPPKTNRLRTNQTVTGHVTKGVYYYSNEYVNSLIFPSSHINAKPTSISTCTEMQSSVLYVLHIHCTQIMPAARAPTQAIYQKYPHS